MTTGEAARLVLGLAILGGTSLICMAVGLVVTFLSAEKVDSNLADLGPVAEWEIEAAKRGIQVRR